MKVTKIDLSPDLRVLRFGVGQNLGRWFARVDLWSIAYRLTKS